jgi:hypothetical protein
MRRAAKDRLQMFEVLFVFRLTDVVSAGFEVVPTFRSAHVTIGFYDEPAVGVARLLAVPHRDLVNPAFEGRPS